jgi:hypothetical protein
VFNVLVASHGVPVTKRKIFLDRVISSGLGGDRGGRSRGATFVLQQFGEFCPRHIHEASVLGSSNAGIFIDQVGNSLDVLEESITRIHFVEYIREEIFVLIDNFFQKLSNRGPFI